MNRQELKDRFGNRIGEIKEDSNGNQTLYDRMSNRLGEYRKDRNVTLDRLGNRVGDGNQLTRLLTS